MMGEQTMAKRNTEKTEKLDLYKEYKSEYVTPKQPTLIDAGPAGYLAIDGQGLPGGEMFTTHLQALYSIAFTIKMTSKFAGRDYRVCHLEGIWRGVGAGVDLAATPPEEWKWTLMIRTPQFITQTELSQARAALEKKKKPPQYKQVRLDSLAEGRCVQMLHVGPYETEPETIQIMREFVMENNMRFAGPQHEIYLSDPRRVPPQRLRTILRIPVG